MKKPELYALDIRGVTRRKSSFSENETDMCLYVADLGDGAVSLSDPDAPHGKDIRLTGPEWKAFKRGVVAGEFDS